MVDSKTIAAVVVIKVDVAWADADVVIWVTDKIVVVMVAHHVAAMADTTMETSVAALEVDTAVVAEAATAALQEAVMVMDQSQEVVIIMVSLTKVLNSLFLFLFQVLLKVAGILDHLVTVHQTTDMAAATVVVMAVVITNHKAVAVDMVVHQWVVVAAAATEVAAVITKETAVEVVVVVAVPIAADKITEAVLVHTELLSLSPPLCFVLG